MNRLGCRVGCVVAVLVCAPGFAAAQVPTSAAAGGTPVDRVLFGALLGVAGMAAVFVGLLAVFAIMSVLRYLSPGGKVKERGPLAAPGPSATPVPQVTAEVAHAIALALYMDLRTLDDSREEVLTIQRITRPHSPWWYSAWSILVADNRSVFTRTRR